MLKNKRIFAIFIIIFIAFIVGVIKLTLLVVNDSKKYEAVSKSLYETTIYSQGMRGNIYDRNGVLLAGNKSSYSLIYNYNDVKDKNKVNEHLYKLIGILKNNKEEISYDFPIVRVNNVYRFIYDIQIENFLKSEKIPLNTSAKDAFKIIREKFGVDKNLDKFEAQKVLIDKHQYYPPISVTNMKWTYEIEKEEFLGNYNLTSDNAINVRKKIISYYGINPNYNEEYINIILGIRNEVKKISYMSYSPIKIAKSLKEKTVLILEEESSYIKGISVILDYQRYYPNRRVLSHVLGYIGEIPESEKVNYLNNGYMSDDQVGLSGVEKEFEDVLRGKYGVRKIEINSFGEKIADISEEVKPLKGDDIYLTIDINIQKSAENSLRGTIISLQNGKDFSSEFGFQHYNKDGSNSNSGAVVAIDVNTGEPLAIASYPNYDPNLFVNGISTKEWNNLQPKNQRDALAPRPLYNIALSTAVQPGSTFKMITALNALEKGFDPNKVIHDNGYIKLNKNDIFACLLWNEFKQNHGNLTLKEALRDSCNYFFYCLGTGIDWNNKSSLGYKTTVDDITNVAKRLGLGTKTGIELNETIYPVPDSKTKLDQTKNQVISYLISNAKFIFKKDIYEDESLLLKKINEIADLTSNNVTYEELYYKLNKIGITKTFLEDTAKTLKYTYFNFSTWQYSDQFNISIGQGENRYTPFQLASYIAALGNEGVYYNSSIIYKTKNKGVISRKVRGNAELNPKDIQAVLKGMKLVANNSGPLSSLGSNIGAKTGTAEVGGYKNPESEVEYIKKNLKKINKKLSWKNVYAEMNNLLRNYSSIYKTEDVAIRAAVKNLSSKNFDVAKIDIYKAKYKPYGWMVGLAPLDNPKVAVSTLVVQAGTSQVVGGIVRDTIGSYLKYYK